MNKKSKIDTIELLNSSLFNNKKENNEVYKWIKMFTAEVGWHYPLDLIWQYKNIMSLQLPKGATILDAGAGFGLMQFILAGNGFNVISVDFTKRKLPIIQSKLFKMSSDNQQNIENEYTEHLSLVSRLTLGKSVNKLKLAIINFSWFHLIKGFMKRRSYGKVSFVQADFSDLSFILSNSIDAIVSTSAIEHNPDHESLKKGISEFDRILKPNSGMFITTSVTDKECIFDKPTKGYLYDEKALIDIFKLGNFKSNYSEYPDIYKKINTCEFLKRNLPYSYQKNANCGMPFGVWNPRYLPAGVIKWKN